MNFKKIYMIMFYEFQSIHLDTLTNSFKSGSMSPLFGIVVAYHRQFNDSSICLYKYIIVNIHSDYLAFKLYLLSDN